MRTFAWLLLVVGLAVAVGSPFYAEHETARREQAWHDGAMKSYDLPRLERTIAMRERGLRPAWVVVSPWPGVAVGAALAAFGVLLLAIRRPRAPVLPEAQPASESEETGRPGLFGRRP